MVLLSFLDRLEYYCKNEDGYKKLKESTKHDDNFNRITSNFSGENNDLDLDNVELIYTTTFNSIKYILKENSISSYEILQSSDLEVPLTVKYKYELSKYYVSVSFNETSMLKGMYEIVLDDDIVSLENSLFIPKGVFNYHNNDEVSDVIMDASRFNEYLSLVISNENLSMKDYIKNTPFYQRPTIYIKDMIHMNNFKYIRCKTEKSYIKLKDYINEHFLKPDRFLKLLKVSDNNE